MIPLILSPLWNHQMYQLEFEYQKRRIWLDNSAIRLGVNDRDLFNQLERLKKRQEKLHVSFHQALACTLTPQTAPACIQLVKELKILLMGMIKNIELTSQFHWKKNREGALDLFNGKGYEVVISRSRKVPLEKKRCHICQEDFILNLSPQEKATELTTIIHPILKSTVTLEKVPEGSWNYRLQ